MVVIAPTGPRRPSAKFDAGFCGHVGESTVMIIVIKTVLAKVRHVQVGPAVIVVVTDGNTESPALVGNAGFVSHVSEGAIVIVVEQHCFRCRLLALVGV